jgi:hypothetical protein
LRSVVERRKAPDSASRASLASRLARVRLIGRVGRLAAAAAAREILVRDPSSAASSIEVGGRPSRAVSCSRRAGTRMLGLVQRARQPHGRMPVAQVPLHLTGDGGHGEGDELLAALGSKRSIAFSSPMDPACTRSSCSAPRRSCRWASASTSGM